MLGDELKDELKALSGILKNEFIKKAIKIIDDLQKYEKMYEDTLERLYESITPPRCTRCDCPESDADLFYISEKWYCESCLSEIVKYDGYIPDDYVLYNDVKEDAELGKALNLAIEEGYEFVYKADMDIDEFVDSEDKKKLLEWYNKNKGE